MIEMSKRFTRIRPRNWVSQSRIASPSFRYIPWAREA